VAKTPITCVFGPDFAQGGPIACKAIFSTESDMKAKNAELARKPAARETADLDVRYGEIGISAVAAAMRYHYPTGKKPEQKRATEDEGTHRVPEIAA
jgi:hypothetical protein